jgi:hypothetical protein
MRGYQIYITASIDSCALIHLLPTIAYIQTLVSRSSPAVPVSPGHAMYNPHLYPQSHHRRQ